MQKVKIIVMISGDYVAFHEISLNVVYDVTNDIQLDDWTLEELNNWKTDGRRDVREFDGFKDENGKYYMKASLY